MKPEQSRAARAWLDWPQAKLAKESGVGLSTLKDFESGKRSTIRNNLQAIQRALEAGGAKFTADTVGGPIKEEKNDSHN